MIIVQLKEDCPLCGELLGKWGIYKFRTEWNMFQLSSIYMPLHTPWDGDIAASSNLNIVAIEFQLQECTRCQTKDMMTVEC